MAVTMGKREQIVSLTIGGIVLIGLLHMVVFGPRANKLSKAVEKRKKETANTENLKILRNRNELPNYKKSTKSLGTFYQSAVTSVGLELHPAFLIPTFEGYVFTAPKGLDADAARRAKRQSWRKHKEKLFVEQTELVRIEIRKLIDHHPNRPGNESSTQMTFLSRDWLLPTALPDGVQGGMLKDSITKMRDNQITREWVPKDRGDLLAQLTREYEAMIFQLGIDYRLYRNPQMLPRHGDFVPLIHKMAHADLIEAALSEALGEDLDIGGEIMTRERLYGVLEIDIPELPYVDKDKKDQELNEMYFLWEQLRFINGMMETAKEDGIGEIVMVQLFRPSYLYKIIDERVGEEGQYVEPEPTPPPTNRYVLPAQYKFENPPLTEQEINNPKGATIADRSEKAQGYALPVRLVFHATNRAAMNFMFNVTREFLLCEVDELKASADTRSEANEAWFQVRFVHVPYVFPLEGVMKKNARQRAIAEAKTAESGQDQAGGN